MLRNLLASTQLYNAACILDLQLALLCVIVAAIFAVVNARQFALTSAEVSPPAITGIREAAKAS